MPLLVPLAIFIVLAVVMIVLVAKTKSPSAAETVEALCDAIIREDRKTQSDLIDFKEVNIEVADLLIKEKDRFNQPGKKYPAEVLKTWDNENNSFEKVKILLNDENELVFTCRLSVNQWNISAIELNVAGDK